MFPLTKQNEPLEGMGQRGQQNKQWSDSWEQLPERKYMRRQLKPKVQRGTLGSTTEASNDQRVAERTAEKPKLRSFLLSVYLF